MKEVWEHRSTPPLHQRKHECANNSKADRNGCIPENSAGAVASQDLKLRGVKSEGQLRWIFSFPVAAKARHHKSCRRTRAATHDRSSSSSSATCFDLLFLCFRDSMDGRTFRRRRCYGSSDSRDRCRLETTESGRTVRGSGAKNGRFGCNINKTCRTDKITACLGVATGSIVAQRWRTSTQDRSLRCFVLLTSRARKRVTLHLRVAARGVVTSRWHARTHEGRLRCFVLLACKAGERVALQFGIAAGSVIARGWHSGTQDRGLRRLVLLPSGAGERVTPHLRVAARDVVTRRWHARAKKRRLRRLVLLTCRAGERVALQFGI
eukprot:Rhum_TRINITY_DN15127_c5_g2::Rhum_TRINITY_DN15127_c5_g2_i10::g.139977::m.139977